MYGQFVPNRIEDGKWLVLQSLLLPSLVWMVPKGCQKRLKILETASRNRIAAAIDRASFSEELLVSELVVSFWNEIFIRVAGVLGHAEVVTRIPPNNSAFLFNALTKGSNRFS